MSAESPGHTAAAEGDGVRLRRAAEAQDVALGGQAAAATRDPALGELTADQRAAATHSEPWLLVTGAAGTGKTRTLTARFGWLVRGGTAPERIAVLAATGGRAAALRTALEDALTTGFEQLPVMTPQALAAAQLRAAAPGWLVAPLSAGDRLAMLAERVDELSVRHHDFGGRPTILLGSFVRRIDRLKAELVTAERYLEWALGRERDGHPEAALELEFARIYERHERMLADAGARDEGDLVIDALALVRSRPADAPAPFAQLLIDDAHELDLAAATLVRSLRVPSVTAFGDPDAGLRRYRGAGAQRLSWFGHGVPPAATVALTEAVRCPEPVARAARALLGVPSATGGGSDSGSRPGESAMGGGSDSGSRPGESAMGSGLDSGSRLGGPATGGGSAPSSRPGEPESGQKVGYSLTNRPIAGPANPAGDGLGTTGAATTSGRAPGAVEAWRCADERTQAQSVAIEVERLIGREQVAPGAIVAIVSDLHREGRALAAALEERSIPHRLVGGAAFFARAEIRDLLAWLRLLADPRDAAAVVRALARPPVELRSIDIARCTQIARRRKLDMVSALAAATEAPQVPPEARERIHLFLKLYRASSSSLDSSRPDLYVHRLIERLGLRRQQLFSAQPDVVSGLRALARFGELASSYVARLPQATAREFAISVAAVADYGPAEHEEPDLAGPGCGLVQVLVRADAGGLQAEHVFVVGLHAGIESRPFEPIPDELLSEPLPAGDEQQRRAALHQELYVAASRAKKRLVLTYPRADDRGAELQPAPALERVRTTLRLDWRDKQQELFGPAEALASTYRALRDEVMAGTARAGGRLAELRFDTDLDVSHAVVRYLELLKLAALMARDANPPTQSVAESLHDVNARILQAVTAEQREIFETSTLDDLLLDSERDARARAAAVAARDEPTLQPFLPLRGDGVMLSASDIDTYRTCPLKYKFARVFRIPQEPTLNQRFGILVHQVLERYHAASEPGDAAQRRTAARAAPSLPDVPNPPGLPDLPDLLELLDAGWRRGGFGDSEQERQLRTKATAALTRYHERSVAEPSTPVWFERQFQFKLGRHVLRGRVDRVDRLPGGAYELIDYKTGRPKDAAQLADDVQLSLYAIGARESWRLDSSSQAYYYLLDDQKVQISDDPSRGEWVCEVATEVAEGIRAQGFEPTPSFGACSGCDYRLVCPAAER